MEFTENGEMVINKISCKELHGLVREFGSMEKQDEADFGLEGVLL